MLQQDVINALAASRAREIGEERPGTTATVEVREDQGRAIVHLATNGAPSGAEFIESQTSVNHPAVDKEYLRFLRDDLYIRIYIPRSLPPQMERDLVVRLRALQEHAQAEGYPSTKEVAIYTYDGAEVGDRRRVTVLE